MAKNTNQSAPTMGKYTNDFNLLPQPMKQFYNLMSTSHGQAMLNKIKVEHQEMKVNRTELQSQRQSLQERLQFNSAQADNQFIRNVGGILSVVQTDQIGNVKTMKALTQQTELDPNLRTQLAQVDKVAYNMLQDGVFSQDLNTNTTRMYYTHKNEFEGNDMRFLDLNLALGEEPDNLNKQLALKTFVHETSEAGKKEIKNKIDALGTLITDYSAKLGDNAVAAKQDELNVANNILTPPKPFIGGRE